LASVNRSLLDGPTPPPLGECTIDGCAFAHKSNYGEWFRAPYMDEKTARAIVGIKAANQDLKILSKKRASLKASIKDKKKKEEKKVVKPSEEEEEEEAVTRPLLLSSSSERKAVSQTASSQKNPVSFAPASFLLKCHLAMAGISNLALGFSEGSEEKVSEILKILGTREVD